MIHQIQCAIQRKIYLFTKWYPRYYFLKRLQFHFEWHDTELLSGLYWIRFVQFYLHCIEVHTKQDIYHIHFSRINVSDFLFFQQFRNPSAFLANDIILSSQILQFQYFHNYLMSILCRHNRNGRCQFKRLVLIGLQCC